MWDMFSISITGSSHLKNNIPNQDSAASYKDNTLSIIALSDGLGSCKYSHIGSQAACTSIIESIKTNKDLEQTNLLETIYDNFIENIKPYNIQDCLATCLFAVEHNKELLLFRLGDGAILASSKEKTVCLYDRKDNAFFNMTNHIADICNKEKVEVVKMKSEDFYAVLLCSDGIAEEIKKENYKEFLEEFYTYFYQMDSNQRETELHDLFSQWNVNNSDDKTLICMFRDKNEQIY